MSIATFLLLVVAQLAAAHFAVEYPSWRADSLKNTSYSQYVYPCAGVAGGMPSNNVTAWPLTGGSIKLDLHHPWTYIFINLGLGDNVTNFNYSLTTPFWNETGNGTLCVPKLTLPATLVPTDGQKASIQVVTLGASGSALYNCADIKFSSNASVLSSSDCMTDAGVSYSLINQEFNGSTTASYTNTTGSSNPTSSGKSAGSIVSVNPFALTATTGLALAFAFGMML